MIDMTISPLPGREVCDFCMAPNPPVIYKAKSFAMPQLGWSSLGNWGACTTCASLIDSNQWEQLAQRSIDAEGASIPPEQLAPLKLYLLELHQKFNANRIREDASA
jgi:hypothetical protein